MEEIKVGEYVRTYNGNIFKIIDGNSDNYDIDIDYYKLENTEEEWYELNRYNDNGYFFNEKNIKKHSPNIIDLIEEGDYVNGHLVVDKYKDTDDYGKDFITIEVESDLMLHKSLLEKHIKSIVTKEMMESIKYEV